jgi:hypothetical protein
MQPHEPNPDEGPWPEEGGYRPPSVVPPNWVTRARSVALRHWQPKELALPMVDPDLHRLGAMERSAEVFRHNLASLEYWLSPKGWLREWIKFNCRIAAIIAVPALLVVPLITFALRQIETWIRLIVESTSNLVLFPLSALLVVGLISALVHLAKSLARRQQYRQPPHYYQ